MLVELITINALVSEMMIYFMPLFVMLLSLLLANCGPMYENRYEVIPPRTQSGMYCANNCLYMSDQCHNSCSRTAEQCEFRRSLINIATEKTQGNRTKKVNDNWSVSAGYNPVPAELSCNDDKGKCEKHCQTNYHNCHRNCGGIVNKYRVCTAFCN